VSVFIFTSSLSTGLCLTLVVILKFYSVLLLLIRSIRPAIARARHLCDDPLCKKLLTLAP